MKRFPLIALLGLLALASLVAKPNSAEFEPVDRIVVVGDVHGDFTQLLAVLESAELIDAKRRWVGKKTHLVQIGDLPDRGPDTREIIEFFWKLENQAARAGGRVHILIGNHDAMNLYGDLRYVVEDEFAAFAGRHSKALLEKLYRVEVAWIEENVPESEWPDFDQEYRREWFAERPLGYVEHRQHWMPSGKIGKWVLTRNAVLKIGDSLFVHAGISPEFADWSIESINRAVRERLEALDTSEESLLSRSASPLWYRGLAMNEEALEGPHVERILAAFGVKRIVIGHTPAPGLIVPRFGGRVILSDVGLSSHYGGNLACLEIRKGKAFAIHRGERLELPDGDEGAYTAYLDAVALLERGNERTLRGIEELRRSLQGEEMPMPVAPAP